MMICQYHEDGNLIYWWINMKKFFDFIGNFVIEIEIILGLL
jgi:hypothetical protein